MTILTVVASENGLKLDERGINNLLDKADFYIDLDGRKIDFKKMDAVSGFLPAYEAFFLDGYLAAHGFNGKHQKDLLPSMKERIDHFLPENPWRHLDEVFPLAKDVMIEYLDKWIAYQRLNWDQ